MHYEMLKMGFPLSIYSIKFLVPGTSLRMPKTGLGSSCPCKVLLLRINKIQCNHDFSLIFFKSIVNAEVKAKYSNGTPQLITFETTPAPTVLPPSRRANLCPSSRGTADMSSKTAVTLSPGITILTFSGNSTLPVISAVLM